MSCPFFRRQLLGGFIGGQMIQFFALINVVGVVFRNSAPEGRNLHLKVEDSPALRLKASNGKNRNKCAKEEERRRMG